MSKGMVSIGGLLIMALVLGVMTSRSNERIPVQGTAAGRAGSNYALLDASAAGERDALRVRTDTARGRLWVLGTDGVRIYDAVTSKLIRQVTLPDWSVLDFVCVPGLVIDPSGSAFISSNVLARLWRVDASSFAVTEHDIRLLGKERWDIGFGALAIDSGGVLYGLTSSGGSLWKIDVAGASASMVEIDGPPLRGCAFTSRFLKDFERSRKPWTRPLLHRN